MAKQKITILVGQPSVGKSTLIESIGGKEQNYVINRDEVTLKIAAEHGLVYEELFYKPKDETKVGELEEGMEKYGKVVQVSFERGEDTFTFNSFERLDEINGPTGLIFQEFEEIKSNALQQDLDVIVDMTMLGRVERENMLKELVGGNDFMDYQIEAKVFKTRTLEMFLKDDKETKDEKLKKIMEVFENGEYGLYEDHVKIMQNRSKEKEENGEDPKFIPSYVLALMAMRYEIPTLEEGFDNIEEIKVDFSKFKSKKTKKKKGSRSNNPTIEPK